MLHPQRTISPDFLRRFASIHDFSAIKKKLPQSRSALQERDVGGVSGYQEFLEVIFEPGHNDFTHFRGWAGGTFHAEDLNVMSVNDILSRMRWPIRHRR